MLTSGLLGYARIDTQFYSNISGRANPTYGLRPTALAFRRNRIRHLPHRPPPTLGEAGAARVLGLVERLETLPDLKELTAALRGA
jgi:hypothetical protein